MRFFSVLAYQCDFLQMPLELTTVKTEFPESGDIPETVGKSEIGGSFGTLGGGGSGQKKDLVFRTWTQEMIDNMLKTRRMAIARKKRILETNPSDVINITDYW